MRGKTYGLARGMRARGERIVLTFVGGAGILGDSTLT